MGDELSRALKIKAQKKAQAFEMMREGLLIPQISNELSVAPFMLNAWQAEGRKNGDLPKVEEAEVHMAPPDKKGLGFCTSCGNRTGGGPKGVARPGLCPRCEKQVIL